MAIALTVLVLVSLWPLGYLAKKFVGSEPHRSRIRLESRSEGLETILGVVTAAGGIVERVSTTRDGPHDPLVVDLDVQARDAAMGTAITVALSDIDGVSLTRSALDPD